MALKTTKPTTPSRRGLILVDRSELWKGKPVKSLTKGANRTGGRNSNGHITSYNIGGGVKRSYRLIDFKRNKIGVSAIVERLEYDPFRTAFIALIKYETGELSYILAPQKLKVGDTVMSGPEAEIKVGNSLPLMNIPVGSTIHNIELKVGKGAQLARSAGAFAQYVGRDKGFALVTLSSGEQRKVPLECYATLGSVSNPDHMNQVLAKAGRSRWKGIRPHVRGVAKNPVDHPMGGNTSGGRHPVSPWGQIAKGLKTRKNKFTSKYIVKRRR